MEIFVFQYAMTITNIIPQLFIVGLWNINVHLCVVKTMFLKELDAKQSISLY